MAATPPPPFTLNELSQLDDDQAFSRFGDLVLNDGTKLQTLFNEWPGTRDATLRVHTARVLEIFYKQWPDLEKVVSSHLQEQLDLKNLLRYDLFLHDIGKPLAVAAGDKHLQHQFTAPILNEVSAQMKLSPSQAKLVFALIDNDIIGEFIQGKVSLEDSIDSFNRLAKSAGLDRFLFFRLQTALYISDAASYPYLAPLFELQAAGKRVLISPIFQRLKVAIES